MKYKLTDTEIEFLKENVLIEVDSSVKNKHILNFLEQNNLKYEIKKLDTGAFIFVFSTKPVLGIDHKFFIKKKYSVNELVSIIKGILKMANIERDLMGKTERLEQIKLLADSFQWEVRKGIVLPQRTMLYLFFNSLA